MTCILIGTLISLPGSIAQVRQRTVCGKVIFNNTDTTVARTQVTLYFGDDALIPGAITDRDGTFCIENFVSDLNKSTPARLYVTSFCRPDDVTLVDVPFWPRLRRNPRFAGKHIRVGPGSRPPIDDVGVQIVYGHLTLRILDERHQPLMTQPSDWSPVWIRVRDQNGVTVHESGLSATEIERSVNLKESRINLALPTGIWTLEIALSGVPPDTGAKRRAVGWLRVPGKLKIESCAKAVDVAVSVS